MKRTVVVLVGIVVLVGLCYAGYRLLMPHTLVIAGPKNISMLPIIAEKEGFFTKHGVRIRFEPMQSGKVSMDAVFSGDIDFGVLVETNVAFIKYREGADVRVLCSIQEKCDDAVVARRDRGISGPADLVGKNVGYFPATTSDVYLSRLLEAKGVDINKVRLTPMTPPALEAAVKRGELDAVSVWQPYRYNAMQDLGANGLEIKDRSVYRCFVLLAARGAFVQKNAEVCKGVVKALLDAEEFVRTHPSESKAILSKELGIAPATFDATWSEYVNEVRLTSDILTLTKQEGEWIRRTQKDFTGKPVPSYDDVLEPAILQSVAPDRVDLK